MVTAVTLRTPVSEDRDAACTCLLVVFAGACAVALVIWLVFAIMAVSNVSNAEVKDVCGGSSLWPCVVTWITVIGLSLLSSKSAAKEDRNTTSLCVSAMVQLGLLAWLGYELYNECAVTHLSSWELYTAAQPLFIGYCCVLAVVALAGCCFLCMICESAVDNLDTDEGTPAIVVEPRSPDADRV
jgi:uncharacterized integral membrane protein